MTNETAGGSIAEFVQARGFHWIQPLPFGEARIMAAELLKLDGRCMSLIERLATLETERDELSRAMGAIPPSRMRLVRDPVTGPRLEVYVQNDDLRGWHWDWFQTLSDENADTWDRVLAASQERDGDDGE